MAKKKIEVLNAPNSPSDTTPEQPSDTQNILNMLNPWGDELIPDEDYVRLCEEFGIQLIQDLALPASMYDNNRFLRRNIIYGHRDFEIIVKAVQEQKKWVVMSGIKPSGKFHLGTLCTASEIVEFQKMGGYVFYAIADIESYVDNGMPYEQSFQYAIDNLADVLTIGLDPKRAYIWCQSREKLVKEMPFHAGQHVTSNMMRAIYGERPFALYMAALVQVGDILLPQLKEGEPFPTVVPVGIDQDPHLRLTRDLTRFFTVDVPVAGSETKQSIPLFKPAATYHKLLPGLDDITKKMSKSRPNSYFNLGDDPVEIRKKFLNAMTGGRGNKEDHIRLGGIPEKCMIFRLLQVHFDKDDKSLQDRYIRCRGGLLCTKCKKESVEIVINYIKEHNEKKRDNLSIARELLSI